MKIKKESVKRTTVNLTLKAQRIKDFYVPGYELKGILSVGLELFDALDDTDKFRRVSYALAEDKASRKKAKEIIAAAQAVSQEQGQKKKKRGRSSKAG